MAAKNVSPQKDTQDKRVDKKIKLPRAQNNGILRLMLTIAVLFSVIAMAVAGFAIYSLQPFTNKATDIEDRPNNMALLPELQHHISVLQVLTQKQSAQLNQHVAQLDDLSTQDTVLKNYIDQQIAGISANQAEIRQRLLQFGQSYLEPSTALAQQIQLMHKQVVINNLNFAKNAWGVLGNRSQALFFINQANAALLKLDHGGTWLEKLYAIKIAIENSPSLVQRLRQIMQLNKTLDQLQLLPPITASATEASKHAASHNWQDVLGDSWAYIKSLINIVKISDTDKRLTDEHRRIEIRGLILLELSELQLAVINQLPESFKQTQSQIETLIQSYFIHNQDYQAWVNLLHAITLPKILDVDALINTIIHNIDQTKASDQIDEHMAK